MKKHKSLLIGVIVGLGFTFNVQVEQNQTGKSLTFGAKVFAQNPPNEDEDGPTGDGGDGDAAKRYSTVACWVDAPNFYGGYIGSQCKTPDKNGPCDRTSTCR